MIATNTPLITYEDLAENSRVEPGRIAGSDEQPSQTRQIPPPAHGPSHQMSHSPTEPQLQALRDLASFYRATVAAAADPENHPLISIWDAFEDPVAELQGIVARHPPLQRPQDDDDSVFDLREQELLANADFDTLAQLLAHELDWAIEIHSDNGLPVCGFETGNNADRLFSITARAAQLVAEADGDEGAEPETIFHDHPYTIFVRG